MLFPANWIPGDPVTLDGAQLAEEARLSMPGIQPAPHEARLYENYADPSYPPGALPLTLAALRDSLNRGYNLAYYVGAGSTTSLSVVNDSLRRADALASTNGARLANLFVVGAAAGAIDEPALGKGFMLAPGGGAVTFVGSTNFTFPTAVRLYLGEFVRLL